MHELPLTTEALPEMGTTAIRVRAMHLRDLAIHLAQRELSARHRDSVLGWIWAFAPAFVQLLVYQFIFTRIIPLSVPDYGAFLFAGILGWMLFSNGLLSAVASLEKNRSIVLRPGVPMSVVPLTACLLALLDYLFALPILVIVVALTGHLGVGSLLLPLPIIIEFILVVGLALLVAPLQVLFRDVIHLVGLLMLVGFWVTPIFYTPDHVPERFGFLLTLNPLAQIIDAQRGLLLEGAISSPWSLVATGAVSTAIFAVGIFTFARLAPSIPDRL
jgi:lipopolysaccharide transport system permease protein